MTKIQNVFQDNLLSVPPLWLMRQAGRYLPEYRKIRQSFPNFMTFCFSPDAATEVTLQPIERFNFDAAIIFSDILTIPHALGQDVAFAKGEGPVLEKVLNWEKFIENSHSIEVEETLLPVYKALKQTRSALSSEKSLFGFSGAPWTVSTYMIEEGKSESFSKILRFSKESKYEFIKLLDLLTKKTIQHLKAQIDAGADIVQIFDTWASIVPKEHQEAFLVTPVSKIINSVHESHPEVPIIYFAKGSESLYPDLLEKVFLKEKIGFSMGYDADHRSISSAINVPLQGGLSPQTLVEGGTKLKSEVQRIKNIFSNKPFIFNLGHGILPTTPVEHVYELVEYVRESHG